MEVTSFTPKDGKWDGTIKFLQRKQTNPNAGGKFVKPEDLKDYLRKR